MSLGFASPGAHEEAGTSDRRSTGELPGDATRPAELERALEEQLRSRGPGYRPRTRHLREDGGPKYSNRLLLESSPYLLQHAHNPVDWYPWGAAAFEAARRLDRPLLLSVGYSTCHWCHVMEEESFEDPEIAAFLNAHYVAIKVDREERPDVDAIYMTAVQMLSGQGGWPMTVWLSGDGAPFFGGTYFPPRDGDRGAGAGFLTVLRELSGVWDKDRGRLTTSARYLTEYLRQPAAPAGDVSPARTIDLALQSYAASYDSRAGGLGHAPKFPSSLPVRLLLRAAQRTGDERWRRMALHTLTAIARGGIHDQIGGGFHRYSVDAAWRVPHFEKMLYDNALLVLAYLEGHQASGDSSYATVAELTLGYLDREMSSPDGAFYSATDADSARPDGEREEGWFFTWTPDEIRGVLDPPSAALIERHLGVTSAGNFERRNVLYVAEPVAPEALPLVAEARDRLYRARRARPAPLRDEKVLASWNGLAISAFARAALVLDRPVHAQRAARAARFVLGRMRVGGRLRRVDRPTERPSPAFVDDYACLIAGLIDLYEATADPAWLGEAIALQEALDRHYWDEASGGYFRTSDDHEALLVREKPDHDGAEPSGNSVALLNLRRLHALTLDDRHRVRADAIVRAFARTLTGQPTALGEMLLGLEFGLAGPREILLVAPDRKSAEPLLAAVRSSYVPASVLAWTTEDERAKHERWVPAFAGKRALDGRATAYVCRGGACQLPITDARELARRLAERESVDVSPGAKDAGIRPRND